MFYEWILFDADETLFHFDACAGLQRMLKAYAVEWEEVHFEEYQVVNRPLWVDYQEGRISAAQVQERRFANWAERLQVSSLTLNSAFLSAMADICRPLEGAVSLLESLRGRARMGIITNGFGELQQIRLERTGLKEHFELVVVSEVVGVAKPHPEIFRHALELMGNPAPDRVLMVGDNPETDILGGMQAGLDTCWINWHGRTAPPGMAADYEVRSLAELEEILSLKSGCAGR
ncbi:MAG: pyrimidine 5'-nucleotidase [Candidatus Eremiobacteraeota bacterium]|nr:pyrimidine 5'-nucleotidase [Candidatus Eremiobacteraeota bacterium]MCW5868816.1 pyrimidine 5'-nucleotidase [Candidatus Eremiobacteraeota bacterium]